MAQRRTHTESVPARAVLQWLEVGSHRGVTRAYGNRDVPSSAGWPVKQAAFAITPREAEVLAAMAQGLRCAEIARVLSISEYTVRKHRANMMARLAVRNAPQLVAFARLRGWLMPAPAPPGATTHGA